MQQWESLVDYEITGEIVVSCPRAASIIRVWLRDRGEFFEFWRNRWDWPEYRPGDFIFEGLDEEPVRQILKRFPSAARQPIRPSL